MAEKQTQKTGERVVQTAGSAAAPGEKPQDPPPQDPQPEPKPAEPTDLGGATMHSVMESVEAVAKDEDLSPRKKRSRF